MLFIINDKQTRFKMSNLKSQDLAFVILGSFITQKRWGGEI